MRRINLSTGHIFVPQHIAELARLRNLQDAALTRGDTPLALAIGRDITKLTRQMENPRG